MSRRRVSEVLWRPPATSVKLAIFLVFVTACLYSARQPLAMSATYPPHGVYNWIYTVNQGHPFFLYTGEPDGTPIDRTKLLPFYKVWGDYGDPLAIGLSSIVFSWVPFLNEHVFTNADAVYVRLLLLLALSAVFLLPRLPTLVAIAAQVALHLSTRAHFLTPPPVFENRSLDILAVTMATMFVLVVTYERRWQQRLPFYLSLGLLSGWLPLYRSTSSFIIVFALASVLLATAAIKLLETCSSGRESGFSTRGSLKQIWLPTLLVIACFLGVKTFTVAVYASAYDEAPSRAVLPTHGSGQPLYLSLGYVSNPYNIAWEDETSLINYQLYYDVLAKFDHETQKNLSKIYWHIVAEDPLLLARNVVAKMRKMSGYILSAEVGPEDGKDIVGVIPTRTHSVFYVVLLAFIGVYTLFCFLIRTIHWRLIFILIGFGGLCVAAFAPPLLVFPGYYGSVLGCSYSTALILIPGIVHLHRRCQEGESASALMGRRVRRFLLLVVAVLTGLVAVYGGFRAARNYQASRSLVASGNPMEDIEEQGYRYAAAFNRLDIASQEAIITRILDERQAPNLFCNPDASAAVGKQGHSSLFLPVCAIATHSEGRSIAEVHLIAQLSDRWSPVIPRSDQGPVGSWVNLGQTDCGWGTTPSFYYDHGRCLYHRMSDANWNGKYYFLSYPASPLFGKGTDVLEATAFEIARLGPQGLENRRIDSALLEGDGSAISSPVGGAQ